MYPHRLTINLMDLIRKKGTILSLTLLMNRSWLMLFRKSKQLQHPQYSFFRAWFSQGSTPILLSRLSPRLRSSGKTCPYGVPMCPMVVLLDGVGETSYDLCYKCKLEYDEATCLPSLDFVDGSENKSIKVFPPYTSGSIRSGWYLWRWFSYWNVLICKTLLMTLIFHIHNGLPGEPVPQNQRTYPSWSRTKLIMHFLLERSTGNIKMPLIKNISNLWLMLILNPG